MAMSAALCRDLELLRSFPGSTSPSAAANAISRAVMHSMGGHLPAETLNAARSALASLASHPQAEALPGLVGAVESATASASADTFVLTASAWKALLGLAALVQDIAIAERIIQAAASSALSVLQQRLPSAENANDSAATRRLRIARFHTANGARCARAFFATGIRGGKGDATACAVNLFGAIALYIAGGGPVAEATRSLAAPAAAFLEASLRILGPSAWTKALQVPPLRDQNQSNVASYRCLTVLYLTRCARAQQPLNEFQSSCSVRLRKVLLPALWQGLNLHPQLLLDCKPSPGGPSIANLIAAGISTSCAHLDRENQLRSQDEANRDSVPNSLLLRVASPPALSAGIASGAVRAVAASRGPRDALRVLFHVRNAMQLAKAVDPLRSGSLWGSLYSNLESDLRARGAVNAVAVEATQRREALSAKITNAKTVESARSVFAELEAPFERETMQCVGDELGVEILTLLSTCMEPRSTLPVPPRLVLRAKHLVGVARAYTPVRRAATIFHTGRLLERLPMGEGRSSLQMTMAGARRDIGERTVASNARSPLARLRVAAADVARASASLKSWTEHAKEELEAVACLAEHIKSILPSNVDKTTV